MLNQTDPSAGSQTDDSKSSEPSIASVYHELRRFARQILARERRTCMLQPTALVHEAYLRLARQHAVPWKDQTRIRALAAGMMRRVLVDHARRRAAQKRGKGFARLALDASTIFEIDRSLDLIALEESLQQLASLDQRHARIVELTVYGGLTIREVADLLGLSERTVAGDLRMARAWLIARLGS